MDESTPRDTLSLRARILQSLEAAFPLVDAPATREDISAWELDKATGSYQPFIDEVGGLEGKAVLDFGCGHGGETLWLAQNGAAAVGVDIDNHSLAECYRLARAHPFADPERLRFREATTSSVPVEDNSIDLILSTNVFEHVMDIPGILAELHRVLKPGGSLMTRFGPLFYSPRGYHLSWATQVPWAHLLFGFKPVIEVRNQKRQPAIHPETWEDTGLNRLTFARFKRSVAQSGFEVRRLERIPACGLSSLANIPGVGELFTFGIETHLRKPVNAAGAQTDTQPIRRAA